MNYLGTEVKGYLSALLVLLLFLSEIPVCGAEDSGKVDEYRSLVINDSPLAYWPLDDSMSGGSADVMGNAPDITSGEDLEFVEMQPNLGGAIKLDGEKQYLKVNPNIPRLPDTFSIELWIQFDEMAGEDERGILFVPSTNDRKGLFVADEDSEDFSFGATKKGHVAFSYWGDFSYSVSDPDPIVAGELYHYVVTYGDEVLSLYRNGTLVNSIEEFESIYIYSDSYFIGGHPSSNNNDVQVEEVINGLVSDIAIYDYALSGDKVEQHYKSGVGISDSDYLVITNDTIILESDTRSYFITS
ncbi:LamG domain-containing protein [Microbulbifer thermotolerans]|uniref:LamG domain-containing protein n=1 Tax=Microbulbifer thermotolerans TaxID=252514 RepID=UPI002672DD56|nr:LamG domain-containing protein [Microbulbifer thermotolerans]WKT59640.1 LamG domain-containing protein [Microbulbifer thermotolerans]